ncbi:class I SAM-dependent methyltransferase [Candidatus Micrarchaeota archaeon]|nr:class I SAM-dependent methyltransferase [Candidatus Micrarchaeota archaeon]
MDWLDRWNTNTKGQTGHIPDIVNDVKTKLDLSGNESILDVGCGSASLMEKLPAREKTGLDPSDALRAEAEKRNIHVIKGVSWELPFGDETFDRVLFYSVIHYMTRSEADRTITELKRVCKKGGKVLVGDVADTESYMLGPIVFEYLREPILSALDITRPNYFSKKWFTDRGFTIAKSANSVKRFDALFDKKEQAQVV